MEMDALRKGFRDDGVVVLRGALDDAALADALAAYEWSLAHPGPGASRIRQHGDALFYQDLYNPGCTQAYRAMLERSPLTRIVADIWQTPDVWFMYEQVFLKEGGESRRTPWHQDSSYLAVDGADLAVAWISFDAVAQQDSLDFWRGLTRRRRPGFGGGVDQLRCGGGAGLAGIRARLASRRAVQRLELRARRR